MNKIMIALLSLLFPALVFAQNGDSGGALTFAPPASDYSVIFLGNLFGVVDGILHGTGSQIMGAMFGVFNAAVLALGGIVIMYTLMVSTMNTAHEGQMLGQKWSSIWIPVRSTLGLALLIPKASGYCMMQIFVMWVVVQGIGAADKIWEAALSYLNRGGVIIQAQANPGIQLMYNGTSEVATGASIILPAQVCMLGLQQQLQNQRQNYLNLKQNNSGPCSGTPSDVMNTFCNTAVPDFIGSVNAVTAQTTAQNNDSSTINFTVQMPNFDTAPYNALNGICGTIAWNTISKLSSFSTGSSSSTQIQVTSAELQTAQMSRAIAIQQMYLDLALVAQVMVNNNPSFSPSNNSNSTSNTPFSLVANQQFGVPYTADGQVCTLYSNVCKTWGVSPVTGSSNGGVLFNGSEFLGAINDYNGIMMPTLNLIRENDHAAAANASRLFIAKAEAQGWIMAGSYFFDLVKLNGDATAQANDYDSGTGLTSSQFNAANILNSFGPNNSCIGTYAILCQWFGGDKTSLNMVESLIDGSYLTSSGGVPQPSSPIVSPPNMAPDSGRPLVANQQSSTVYGFINNSLMLQLPGQPGLSKPLFADIIHFNVDTTPLELKQQNFECGKVKIVFFSFCLGEMLGDVFYNKILLSLYNLFMDAFHQIINQVIMAFLMIPIQGMSDIFKQGVALISTPGINPIIALAHMGTMYINFAGNLWLMILDLSVSSAVIPVFGVFIFALIALGLPLITAWVGIMLAIGFTTAYYIPILPYMIFTFGSIAWLIAVIEAMVAAPIVALGVTHPEGHDAFGKGEHAVMILMNIFLRPSMMIIGYIAAIALSYVGVWILNAGFDHAISFIQHGDPQRTIIHQAGQSGYIGKEDQGGPSGSGGYSDWAGIFAFFFSILSYTTMYLIIVQRAFTLISVLPDKVLRWIGGHPETAGSEAAQWGDELKQKGEKASEESAKAQGQIGQKLGGYGGKIAGGVPAAVKEAVKGKGEVTASGESTPTPPTPE